MCTVVRVISLPDASERRARFSECAPSKDKVDWEFFDAGPRTTDGIAYSRDAAIVSQGRELRDGEIGCFTSHYRLWKQFLASDHKQMLVLEDDVFVDWPAVLPYLSLDFHDHLDYLRFHAMRPALARDLGWLCGRRVLQYLHYCYGTQAYLITRAGAEKFIEAAKVIDRPIDDFMDRSWHHGIPNLAIFPFPVMELSGASSIGGAERFETKPLMRREQIKRISYRINDKLRRLYHAARELSPVAEINRESLGVVTPCMSQRVRTVAAANRAVCESAQADAGARHVERCDGS